MRTITICQPYAELILRGEKLVENRTWRPPIALLGRPLAIHAGKSRSWLDSYSPLPDRMDFGALVGVCVLVDCITSVSIYSRRVAEPNRYLYGHAHVEGPLCWVLQNVRRLAKPIPFKGAQGLFDVPDELVKELMP